CLGDSSRCCWFRTRPPPSRPQAIHTTCSTSGVRCEACGATSPRGTWWSRQSSQAGRSASHAPASSAWESFPACSTPSLSAHMPPRRSTPPRVRIRVHPLGDSAVLAELGTRLDTAVNTRAIALAAALTKRRDVRQALAGRAGVTVQSAPDQTPHAALAAAIRRLAAKRPPVEEPGRLHRIPVVYDGPDLAEVCERLALTREQLV